MSAAKTFEVVDAALDLVSDLAKKMGANNHHEWGWHFPRYRAFAKALFERSPIKKGARVRLTKTPDINEKDSWGWLGAKHFLVAGAMATVADVDFSKGKFSAGLVFDDESWLPNFGEHAGKPQPVTRPSQYWFSESSFEVVVEAPAEAGEAREGVESHG